MSRRPARSRRAHRILVTALVLSPLVALVVLVLVMLRTIEQRAAVAPGAEASRTHQAKEP
ncbi:MAG: hypothetical protein ACF8R7_18335 [Phycisphaerales bacterium JB039]